MTKEGREAYERQKAAYKVQQDKLVLDDQLAALARHENYVRGREQTPHEKQKGTELHRRVRKAKRGTERVSSNKGCGPSVIVVAGVGALAAAYGAFGGERASAAEQLEPVPAEVSVEQPDIDPSALLDAVVELAGHHATSLLVSIEDSGYEPTHL